MSRPIQILLRSHWQDCNIGDIAHTPGMLRLLQEYFAKANVVLWPFSPLTETTRDFFRRHFPSLDIVEGVIGTGNKPSTPELARAIEESALFLHGSGPATLGWAEAAAFRRITGRPFGVFGVTYGLYGIPERETLSDAAFVFFRDMPSLAKAKADGACAAVMGFCPDAAFGFDLRDDSRAEAYLASVGLNDKTFLCCIPRVRATQFWLNPRKNVAFDPVKHARNEATKVHDHAQLFSSIIAVVRATGRHVLVCPEDETQIAIGREMLMGQLPDDVRAKVVLRETFWLPDEALAIYSRSIGLFGNEMHSPIMCIGNGIPAVVCHCTDASTKGYMWKDIGSGEWLFDLDVREDYVRIVETVLQLATESETEQDKARAARDRVRQLQQAGINEVRKAALGKGAGSLTTSGSSRKAVR